MIGVKQKGFSLIEMLVAMALFLTLALVVSDLYLRNHLQEQKFLSVEKAQTEMSLLIKQISEMIRKNKLIYESNEESGASQIFLQDEFGQQIVVFFEPDSAEIKVSYADVDSTLHSSALVINDVQFLIWPQEDPFYYDQNNQQYSSDAQPLVRIYISAENKTDNLQYKQIFSMQAMVSSRFYGR
ncbi:MAG: prepilin-type N-terminal cleavage/methylation domain-containing protein [Patescibacteria group bacterium]